MTSRYQAEIELPFGSMLLRLNYRRDDEGAGRRRRPWADTGDIEITGAEICDRLWDRTHRRFHAAGPWRDGRPFLAMLSERLHDELLADIAINHADAAAAEAADCAVAERRDASLAFGSRER